MISNTYGYRTFMVTIRWLARQLHMRTLNGSFVYLWIYKQTALLRCQQAGCPGSCTQEFQMEALYLWSYQPIRQWSDDDCQL